MDYGSRALKEGKTGDFERQSGSYLWSCGRAERAMDRVVRCEFAFTRAPRCETARDSGFATSALLHCCVAHSASSRCSPEKSKARANPVPAGSLLQSSAQYGLRGHPQLIESSPGHPIVSAGLRAMEMQSNTSHTKLFSSAGGNYLRLTRYTCPA